jgi:hypothetical protein
LLALSAVEPARAGELDPLLADVEAAATFDYCGWMHRADDAAVEMPQLAELLADDAVAKSDLAAAILVDAGTRVARDAGDLRECRRILQRGEDLYRDQSRSALRRARGGARADRAKDPAIAAAQKVVASHWLADMTARGAYVALQTDDRSGYRFWARQRATAQSTLVDAAATASMRQLLDTWDWIDRHRFGATASKHAWLLVQHADDHPDFQALALERMHPYLENGGVRAADYAYLWDRVAVNSGRLQRYGTQPIWECRDGRLELHPLEEPAGVDERRRAMGLGSLEQGLAAMTLSFCG